ncbi:MAG: Eco57I restriction-modification methylase domain-containing protein [Desulfobacteraceae bacterium]
MKNHGLFSSFFIDEVLNKISLDDSARGRLATLTQTWQDHEASSREGRWETFLKQAVSYLQFVPPASPAAPGVYPLYEDWGFSQILTVLYLTPPDADLDDTAVGRFWPAKLLAALGQHRLTWGILTNGAVWRLYSTKSSRPYEDYVELNLAETLEHSDEAEYGLFERFFHHESFTPEGADQPEEKAYQGKATGVFKCRLDRDREASEKILDNWVKAPLLYQVDEILRYLCNGFIAETPRQGEEYTDEERQEIFASAVRLVYRCLFLFYAEARSLLPSERDKAEIYAQHAMGALCQEARRFQWGQRQDVEGYDLWQHLQGLIHAVHDGDPEYGILGYNGGLFDDDEVKFLGRQRLRNDFLSRALYLLAYVEPYDRDPDDEYAIPYADLEVRHLGELYENILEYNVILADTDLIRRRTKKGVETIPASTTTRQKGDRLIKKGDVFFGATALERKQTGSFYTPESLVRFLNQKAIIEPLRHRFAQDYQPRLDEFLDQAQAGVEAATRRGALQAALALIDRFVKAVVLPFKVCDPAMGSGHFLVNAANQMAGLVVELLAALPDLEGLAPRLTSDINSWRRLITRHCLYGVDLNPLAVDLAKLSLWLNGFAREHKLTFLDHHLRCGNSLIGLKSLEQLQTMPIRKKEQQKKKATYPAFPQFDALSLALADLERDTQAMAALDQDDTTQQKARLAEVEAAKRTRLAPVADLFTAYLMDSAIAPAQYHALFSHLAQGREVSQIDNPLLELEDVGEKVQNYQQRHHFFHWPLEFPEVFGPEGQHGFDATVGNPPWDIIKPNSQEFFSAYDPDFRRYNKQEANKVAARLRQANETIRQRWEDYIQFFAEQSLYVREPAAYQALGSGDLNTYKLFLERFFRLLRPQGRLGIVVPSGLYTDQGCLSLRQLFFSQSKIDFLYGFENRRGIFNIHRSFKFVVFGTEKGGKTEAFKCAFMEHEPERLAEIDANALKMQVEHVKKFSPDSLSVMEFKNQRDIDITSIIYSDLPLLGNREKNWNVKFNRELDMTIDSHIFKNYKTEFPLYEGKMIWQFDSFFEGPRYWVDFDEANETLGQAFWEVGKYRVAYRDIAATTNERTLISTIIPPAFHGNKLPTVTPYLQGVWKGPNDLEALWLTAIFNSFCIDFIIRQKITTTLNFFYMYSLPVARLTLNSNLAIKNIFLYIIARAARLICTAQEFADLWNKIFQIELKAPDFWYHSQSININSYGPRHEQEIRQRIYEQAEMLTETWGPHCGVYDHTPDRRDTGDRAQLRAEIDAYVAHLYGLSREDFAYILDTFPVLRKNEEKAFGEFMSKRKCLEEYDRLATIL